MSATKITIDFSGTILIDPENINFNAIHTDGEEVTITGTQWLKLSEDEKSEYVIESLAHALNDADEINSLEIDVDAEVEEEDDLDIIDNVPQSKYSHEIDVGDEVCTDDIVGITSLLGVYDHE